MNRRMLLNSLLNLFKWLSYSFTNLFNSLVPTTIDGKAVQNKAKVKKIEANGEVVNQLCSDSSEHTLSSSGTLNEYDYPSSIFSATSGHKYLIRIKTKLSTTSNVSTFRLRFYFSTSTSTYTLTKNTSYVTDTVIVSAIRSSVLGIQLNATDCIATFKELEIIDLTQMFGVGNEPTSTDDNRIQKLLNGGYIEYNAGSYKGTDISEFSSKDSNNADLETLPFVYQGNGALNAHDTMEITAMEYVFTKNVGSVDLGTLNWTYQSQEQGGRFSTQLPSLAIQTNFLSGIPNLLCSKYETQSFTAVKDKSIYCYTIGSVKDVFVKDSSYTDADTFKTAMAGVMLYYELATPQVVRIPKKHLRIVDLGSLEWSGGGSSQWYSQSTFNIPHTQGEVANIYCNKYVSYRSYVLNNGTWLATNMTIMISVSSNRIAIMDKSGYADTTAFKNSLQGVYLFYETNSEVADIETQIDIEPNGIITSDSDVLPNVDFDIKCK